MAHILSPWSKDLFHRAIVQSGAITDLRNLIPSHPPEYYARQVCPFIATFMATNLDVGTLMGRMSCLLFHCYEK